MTARQRQWSEKLASIEPGLKLGELAARLGEPYATVQRWASFFGYAIRDGRTERAARVNWAEADWGKTNVEIARELGVSRERVRQVRERSGAQPQRSASQHFAQFVSAHREKVQGMTVAEAIRASGIKVCYEVGRDILRDAGVGPFRRKRTRGEFDWRLPNRDLAEIHHMSVQQVANLRFRINAGPAKWDVRGGRALKDSDYFEARTSELRKASARENASRSRHGKRRSARPMVTTR
jgi:hypothetical protein